MLGRLRRFRLTPLAQQWISTAIIIAMGIAILGVVWSARGITSENRDRGKASACGDAALKAFPEALLNPKQLARAQEWAHQCEVLNGVNDVRIKLPPLPPRPTTAG